MDTMCRDVLKETIDAAFAVGDTCPRHSYWTGSVHIAPMIKVCIGL